MYHVADVFTQVLYKKNYYLFANQINHKKKPINTIQLSQKGYTKDKSTKILCKKLNNKCNNIYIITSVKKKSKNNNTEKVTSKTNA